MRLLDPVGGAVRLRPAAPGEAALPRVAGVLVVGAGLTCHFWLSILPLARDPALRCFIREPDLWAVSEHLYVRPTVVPSFLVMVDGYFVDAFPAPLPSGENLADPAALIRQVRERIGRYA